MTVNRRQHMNEKVIQTSDVQVKGTFDAQRFFETLALLLSRRENVSITVTVHKADGQGEEISEII